MAIDYRNDITPLTGQIIDLYTSSGINRPVNDPDRIGRMYANSNLIVSAWDGDVLVGIARSITDFSFCCYLSDLAIRKDYQHAGIGKKLVALTKEEIGDQAMLLLLSAPEAINYYPKLNFSRVENGFILPRTR
ncbi:MAG: GNAT family N-acetyltransferase [Saprospiraceae bacterium]|jgi:N-acetylglutamate synthase-like GNAT family acetyltransferase|nr:GNAT family N-acetyltransferase [Saprospiraceae bacterium]MBP9209772.1 GNAT family N-acetyltransferase [Saprospiraceae bacterium]MBV6473327.1 hypothetical protein [Saprospiraceae bacterium]